MTTRLEQYQSLPQAVQDFLFDEEKAQEAEQLLVKDGAPEVVAFDLVLLAEEIVFGTLPMTALSAKVQEITKLPEEKARVVTRDLVTYRLLPLDQYVSGVAELLKSLGGDATAAPVEHVAKETMTPERFVNETLKEANLHLSDPALESRLEFILASYVRGIRPLPQTIAALGRSLKVGGLELDETQSKQLIDLIEKKRGTFTIEVEAEQRVETRQAAAPVAPTTRPAQPSPTVSTTRAELPPVAPRSAPAPLSGPEAATEKLVNTIVTWNIAALASPDLTKRLRNMILTRMKDLRSAEQTKLLLGQPVLTGGLGLSDADRDRVSAEVEKLFEQTRQVFEKKAEEDRGRYLEEKKKKEEERKAHSLMEEEELTKRYMALTGKKAQPVAPAVARLSPASLPPTKGQTRPQMVDVKFAPKLAGPMEEVAQMRIEDFRRLSSDPKEALLKIRDKIDLLGQESYEKKVAGMKAWKASPANQLYLEMSQEALRTGKPVQEVAKAWKEQGKPALTAEEVRAIVELNATLRF